MKKIILTKGFVTQVDDEDYEILSKNKWHVSMSRTKSYAVRAVKDSRFSIDKNKTYRQKSIKMHRLILDCPLDMQVDHIDGNGLNNQKSNLRIVNKYQNAQNSVKPNIPSSTSKFKGVYWSKDHKSWRVKVRKVFGGYFKDEIVAAKKYDELAIKIFGQYANTNFKQGGVLSAQQQ